MKRQSPESKTKLNIQCLVDFLLSCLPYAVNMLLGFYGQLGAGAAIMIQLQTAAIQGIASRRAWRRHLKIVKDVEIQG